MMTAHHTTYQIMRTGASTLPTDCVPFGHFFGEIWMHNIVSTTQIYLIIIAIIYYTYVYNTPQWNSCPREFHPQRRRTIENNTHTHTRKP